jgi:hypothetical protein
MSACCRGRSSILETQPVKQAHFIDTVAMLKIINTPGFNLLPDRVELYISMEFFENGATAEYRYPKILST